eukprot:764272-Hanusia_phi.AAC.3
MSSILTRDVVRVRKTLTSYCLPTWSKACIRSQPLRQMAMCQAMTSIGGLWLCEYSWGSTS